MDFRLTDDQLALQAAAREFAQNEIAPVAAALDQSGEFPRATIAAAGALGFMGVEVPEAYGGAALDCVSFALMIEEVAAADAAHATILSVNNSLFCGALLRHGSEALKQRWVRAVAEGQAIGAYGLSEPHCGSDAGALKARAVLSADGTHYVVNGKKAWITSGPVADAMILFALTDPAAGSRGISAFLVDAHQPGFIRGRSEPKMGIRASATCEIELANCIVPVENRLGPEGAGFRIAMSQLDAGRIGIAAQAVGIARAAYEAALAWVRERQAFGAPIGTFQMVQAKIADMKCRLDAARLLTLRAAWLKDQDDQAALTTAASVAKLTASETAMFCAHGAVQLHGGMGYSEDLPVERYFRDAKITEIYEGTSEIQRLVIARQETGLR